MSERVLGFMAFEQAAGTVATALRERPSSRWRGSWKPRRLREWRLDEALPSNRHQQRIETRSNVLAGLSARFAARWQRSGKPCKMVNVEYFSVKAIALGFGLAMSACGAAQAFDINAGVTKESGPFDLFKFGFKAYKSGQKQDAVEAYRYAAEKGHTGSRWALANMYAYGDGVAQSDFEAFKIYNEIAGQGIEPGSEDTGFFVNALMSLAEYYRHGIQNSPIKADLGQARQLYFQAASAFGVPEAQYQLARMMLRGEGGSRNVEQAKKWLNRARKNGHVGAMGIFGSLLFQEGQTARGLGYMTAALDHCSPQDRPWIQDLQEQAFSVASEDDRRTAIQMAREIEESLPGASVSAAASVPVPPVPVGGGVNAAYGGEGLEGGNLSADVPSPPEATLEGPVE